MGDIKIGTRQSRLALAQTKLVTDMIRKSFPDLKLDVVQMTTAGDRIPLEKRQEVQGKALFTGDIETALKNGDVDIAVHSMKDMSNELEGGLTVGATPLRADARDALVTAEPGASLSALPHAAMVGTSSIRRKAQLRALRSDLSVLDVQGNIDTRLTKVGRLGFDGIVLAAAGLERLKETRRISYYFSVDEMVPAPCQGAIAVEMRHGDEEVRKVLSAIDNARVRAETTCERSFARALGGSCDIPAGANAALDSGNSITLVGVILSPDGGRAIRKRTSGKAELAESLGRQLAKDLLDDGGRELLKEGEARQA